MTPILWKHHTRGHIREASASKSFRVYPTERKTSHPISIAFSPQKRPQQPLPHQLPCVHRNGKSCSFHVLYDFYSGPPPLTTDQCGVVLLVVHFTHRFSAMPANKNKLAHWTAVALQTFLPCSTLGYCTALGFFYT